jgi:hypothetical protein
VPTAPATSTSLSEPGAPDVRWDLAILLAAVALSGFALAFVRTRPKPR